MAEGEVASLVECIEKWQCQRKRTQQNGGYERQRSGKKLYGIEQPARQQAEESADGMNGDTDEACPSRQVLQSVSRIPEVVVRLLVFLPFERGDEKQTATGSKAAKQLGDNPGRVCHMLECDDVQNRVEGVIRKRQM